MNLNVILLAALLGILVLPANAQPQRAEATRVGATHAYVSVGADFLQNRSFNRSLEANALPRLAETQLNIGFGGGVFINRWYFGGDSEVGISEQAVGDVLEARAYPGVGQVRAGYVVSKTRRAIVYPTIGIGGGGAELRIDETSGGASSIFGSETRLQTGFAVASLTLNGDFFLRPASRRGGLVLGLGLGYTRALFSSDWRTSQRSNFEPSQDVLQALPSFDLSGLSFKVKLGWGVKGY